MNCYERQKFEKNEIVLHRSWSGDEQIDRLKALLEDCMPRILMVFECIQQPLTESWVDAEANAD